MTAGRDPVDALEDILRNMALAKEFVGAIRTIDELEADPKTLYGKQDQCVPAASRALIWHKGKNHGLASSSRNHYKTDG